MDREELFQHALDSLPRRCLGMVIRFPTFALAHSMTGPERRVRAPLEQAQGVLSEAAGADPDEYVLPGMEQAMAQGHAMAAWTCIRQDPEFADLRQHLTYAFWRDRKAVMQVTVTVEGEYLSLDVELICETPHIVH